MCLNDLSFVKHSLLIFFFTAGLIVNIAAGLAILSVVKVGFLVTARGGSGIVIAKLEDGGQSSIPAGVCMVDI